MPTEFTPAVRAAARMRADARTNLAAEMCLLLVSMREMKARMTGDTRQRMESRYTDTRSALQNTLQEADLSAVRTSLFAVTEDPEHPFTLQQLVELSDYLPELFADQSQEAASR